uniref:Uncharacterized protein n=1 Tax=Trichuris muris TaxID=70415 RepID=A0A5S6R2W4_TRIMR
MVCMLVLPKLMESTYFVFTNRRASKEQKAKDTSSIRESLNTLCKILAEGDEEKIRELETRLHRLQLREICKEMQQGHEIRITTVRNLQTSLLQ